MTSCEQRILIGIVKASSTSRSFSFNSYKEKFLIIPITGVIGDLCGGWKVSPAPHISILSLFNPISSSVSRRAQSS